MTTTTPVMAPAAPTERTVSGAGRRAARATSTLSSPAASVIAIVIAVLWTVPTLGLLITSFRPELDIRRTGWWTAFTDPAFTLDNYNEVLYGGQTNFASLFVNSLVITLPAVVIPITLALLAAYAFAWIKFRGRNMLFVAVFALQVVPIQVTLIPLLTLYVDTGLAGSFWTIWLSHSIFALPLAVFLLHNYMKNVPAELLEAARIDGAGHSAIFLRVLLPLLRPALAAFGVLQFFWVWNDLLVALTFAGGGNAVAPITVALANVAGQYTNGWHRVSASAFIALIVPLIVFLVSDRYLVRGLLAGRTKD